MATKKKKEDGEGKINITKIINLFSRLDVRRMIATERIEKEEIGLGANCGQLRSLMSLNCAYCRVKGRSLTGSIITVWAGVCARVYDGERDFEHSSVVTLIISQVTAVNFTFVSCLK